jgi:phosphoglycerol transferase MdoB-like AlkP superfamily enzyme
MIHHAHPIQPLAQAPVVREVSAQPLLIPTALLTVVIVVVSMVTAAAGSAVFRKPVVLMIAIAMTACVIIPRLIALINATPTIVIMASVLILLKATVKRIAANWPSPKGRSLIF